MDERAKGREGLTRNTEGPARPARGPAVAPGMGTPSFGGRTSHVGTCRPGNLSPLLRLSLLLRKEGSLPLNN